MDFLAGAEGYREIFARLRNAVTAGTLQPGERLPSQRTLAYDLNLAVGTITRAYREAEKEGLLVSYVGRGSFVTYPGANIRSTFRDQSAVSEIDLSLDKPLEAMNPPLTELLLSVGRDTNSSSLMDYDNPYWINRHRTVGAQWAGEYGLNPDPLDVHVCAGAQHAILCALGSICKAGDAILAEELTYPGSIATADLLGLRIEPVSIDSQGIVPDAVEEACKKVSPKALYLTAALQNPTNGQLNDARRDRIAELSEKYGFMVIEDDLRPRAVLSSPPPIANLIPERTFFIAGLSKSIGGGFRTGYLIAPRQYTASIQHSIWASLWGPSPISVELATRLIESGEAIETALSKEQECKRRRALIEKHLGHLEVVSRPGSTTAWVSLPKNTSNSDAVLSIKDEGVLVASAEAFWVSNSAPPNGLRLSFGTPDNHEILEAALRGISKALAKPGRVLKL